MVYLALFCEPDANPREGEKLKVLVLKGYMGTDCFLPAEEVEFIPKLVFKSVGGIVDGVMHIYSMHSNDEYYVLQPGQKYSHFAVSAFEPTDAYHSGQEFYGYEVTYRQDSHQGINVYYNPELTYTYTAVETEKSELISDKQSPHSIYQLTTADYHTWFFLVT